MNLFLQLMAGGVMIGLTVSLHAAALDFIIKRAVLIEPFARRLTGGFWKPVMSAAVVVSIVVSHIVHIWLWAMLYLGLDCAPLASLSDALYFATVTYTTLGYGDITLDHSCRMLSGVEATNGFLIFGWTTAFIFEVVSRFYKREATSL